MLKHPDEAGKIEPGAIFESASDALAALASPAERRSYEEEVRAPAIPDAYSDMIFDRTWEQRLLPRLLEKLRSGEWVASGFGYESGQPTDLHSRLWQRLMINVSSNSAHDSLVRLGVKSGTGSFHSLGFRIVQAVAHSSHSDRIKSISEVAEYFENLDSKLPSNSTKKEFFRRARLAFGPKLIDAWLRQGWTRAKLGQARREPGTRKSK